MKPPLTFPTPQDTSKTLKSDRFAPALDHSDRAKKMMRGWADDLGKTTKKQSSQAASTTTIAKEEEEEDCMILDGDPDKESGVQDSCLTEEIDEVAVVAEKGQIACRDYPHARHLCVAFPFNSSPHEKFCDLCHCYVCDTRAPCDRWGTGKLSYNHCHSTDKEEKWRNLRLVVKHGNAEQVPASEQHSSEDDNYHSSYHFSYDDDKGIRMTGTLKWFDSQRGYGFIVPDNGGDDLFFHRSSITSDGLPILSNGQKVEFQIGSGGNMAIKVSGLSEITGSNEQRNMVHGLGVSTGTGTVKWFDSLKGYGFIMPDGGGPDLFVHHSSVRTMGRQSLAEGEAVEFQVATDDHGRKRVINLVSALGWSIYDTFSPRHWENPGFVFPKWYYWRING